MYLALGRDTQINQEAHVWWGKCLFEFTSLSRKAQNAPAFRGSTRNPNSENMGRQEASLEEDALWLDFKE